jgi:hypothetical protein
MRESISPQAFLTLSLSIGNGEIDSLILSGSTSSTGVSARYSAATLVDFWAAASRSMTVLQPALKLARFLTMHAVIFGMFGISELHKRNASPVHICCASELKAKLDVEDSVAIEAANANTKPAWRIVRVRRVAIFSSMVSRGLRRRWHSFA